ncbi:MAG: uracil-DNA glycosylase family protein [Candidatus Hodarchaeota archaeon]
MRQKQERLRFDDKRSRKIRMLEIRNFVMECEKCEFRWGSSTTGFGKISQPLIFFVGSNPLVKEHQFLCGKGIKILLEELEKNKFDDFYFDNIIKCQVPKTERKNPDWIKDNCIPFLIKQLYIVDPKNIVLFGGTAVSGFNKQKHISWWGRINDVLCVPTYAVPHFSTIFFTSQERPDIEENKKNYYKSFWKLMKIIKEKEK